MATTNWTAQGKIRKTGGYACGGELVRISPRFRQGGTSFRVAPEKPAAYFAAWCVDNAVLPTPMTADEAQSDAGLQILAPLFQACLQYFEGIEPTGQEPNSIPDLTSGYSYLVPQVLVERLGYVEGQAKPAVQPTVNPALIAETAKKLAELRAKAAKPEAKVEPKAKK